MTTFESLIDKEMDGAALNWYDIHEAFAVSRMATMSEGTFTPEDVADVLHYAWSSDEGYGQIAVTFVCKLNDGRFGVIEASCDTTGWDCQAGGTILVMETLDDAIRFGLGVADREAFGLLLPDDDPSGQT